MTIAFWMAPLFIVIKSNLKLTICWMRYFELNGIFQWVTTSEADKEMINLLKTEKGSTCVSEANSMLWILWENLVVQINLWKKNPPDSWNAMTAHQLCIMNTIDIEKEENDINLEEKENFKEWKRRRSHWEWVSQARIDQNISDNRIH